MAKNCVTASYVVNMMGPWINHLLENVLDWKDIHQYNLSEGSHIWVPKLYAHDRAYVFQNGDGCIIFSIPYQEEFTLLGTTIL
ncbi:hypothetical protein MF1_06190 [Bartonella quintana]|nr:hypothetical protein MF1_06190 [Bartonella quintana]